MHSATVEAILLRKQHERRASVPMPLLHAREREVIKLYETIASKNQKDADLVAAIRDAQLEKDLLSLNKRLRRTSWRKANGKKWRFETRSRRAARKIADDFANAKKRCHSYALPARKLARLASMPDDVVVEELFASADAEVLFSRLGSIIGDDVRCTTSSKPSGSDEGASLEEIEPLKHEPVFMKDVR